MCNKTETNVGYYQMTAAEEEELLESRSLFQK